ncbi:tRNA-specific adenosine deaminase [uncultured archaeon]|nr:tRNA-specific adenosine deaminase [uncultured archaeon]
MTNEQIRESGLRELAKISPKNRDTDKFKSRLMEYKFNNADPDDGYIWLADILALGAMNSGNFGVGCVLTDVNGNVVVRGHNEVFNPYFRSDRHGEMVVMDEFEDAHQNILNLEGFTLYTSLESCPMCLIRLITSGVSRVLHAAPDIEGGMVHKMKNLPQFWIDLVEGQVYSQAECSQELINIANEIFLYNADELKEKLKNRKAPG